MTKKICANVVADSINSFGDRITTFTVTFPRFILAELNTHRVFSRNSASSRARPFKVMLKDVTEDPFVPIRFMSTHKGMQGTTYLDEEQTKLAVAKWLAARDAAVVSAVELDNLGVTKQIVNRLLEPFMWHEVIITATDYENFFALRAHEDAEIHICRLAEAMLEAYNASKPKFLNAGEFHVPFGDKFDENRLHKMAVDMLQEQTKKAPTEEQITAQVKKLQMQIACARCARISYKPFGSEEEYDYNADVRLFNTLVQGGHMSPLEHCARAMSPQEYAKSQKSGNFTGFIQYRKEMANETRTDHRVIKH